MRGVDTVVDARLRELVPTFSRDQPWLCTRPNGQAPKTREFIVINGFTCEHTMGVYNNNVLNVERAFVERYFLCKYKDGYRPPVQPCSRAFNRDELRTFRDLVCREMPNLPRLTRQQLVDCYTGYKRRLYHDAMLSLYKDPINKGDATLRSFGKFEKQDNEKAPRIINPRSPRYNLELGRFIKHAEKHFYRAINKAFGAHTAMTVVKGVNADVSAQTLRDKWERFADPVAIGLDATKFDMHVSVRALKFEHSFYQRLFPGSKMLRRLLSWQLINYGVAYFADGKIKFKMNGTRSSGDLNTSMGNCIIMCAIIHSWCQRYCIDIELANNGDDCVIFLERVDLPKLESTIHGWFKRFGFVIETEEPAFEFEEVEFCQTRPVRLSTGWRMVRLLRSCLVKDPMCLLSVPNHRVFRKWCGAVGECGRILCSGVPVHMSFYSMFEKNGEKCNDRMRDYVFKNTSQLVLAKDLAQSVIDVEARVSYWFAFGVLPDDQRLLERKFADCRFGQIADLTDRADFHIEPGLILHE